MKIKGISALLMAVVLALSDPALSSCSGSREYPVTVGSVTLDKEPEKVVALDKNLADIISAEGYDVKLVGRSDEVNQKELEVVPSVGSANAPSVSAIVKKKADLVLAGANTDPAVIKELSDKNIPVITFEAVNTRKQIKSLYRKTGALLGGSITGKKTGEDSFLDLEKTLKDIKSAVSAGNVVRTICYFYFDNGVLKTFNGSCYGGKMLDYTGAVNVFKNQTSDEADNKSLLLAKPDFIVCSDKSVYRYLKTNSELKKLGALKGNTFIIPLEDITMQGNTSLTVLQKMLKKMYPEEFLT